MLVADKIKESISSALLSAQTGGSLPNAGKIDVKVEKPRNPEHGDFSTNLPLLLARIMEIAPLKIGSEIRERLSTGEIFSKIDLVKPGFINFTLSDEWLQKSVDRIIMAGNDYGNIENLQPLNVQVEFVSVNPTGPLHVGHARGAVIGSALANILSAAGHKVHKEYYVNDAGNQMRLFNETLYFRYLQASGKDCELPEDMYPGEYILNLAKSIYDSHGERPLEMEKDEAINYLAPLALETTLNSIKNTLKTLGVTYDEWFSEKSLLSTGYFDKILNLLKQNNLVDTRDGAVWFLGTKLGADEDTVLIRSGTGGITYFGTDIAYHHNKLFKRKFDLIIDIWGADHHGHVARMKNALKAFGCDEEKLVVILNQIVTFKENGKSLKFSKRKGVMMEIDELVQEVGPDACRFIFLSRSSEAQMDFDLTMAKKQSSENPVFTIQYAHARLCAIQRLAETKKLHFVGADVKLLTDPVEIVLIRKLTELPAIISFSANRFEPHHVAHYSLELARLLNRFYEECQVVSTDVELEPITCARLKLVEAARITFAKALYLMGMNAPEKM